VTNNKQKRTTLTYEENLVWEEHWENLMLENPGMDDADADEKTWKHMQEVFLRLKEFDGCRPGSLKRGDIDGSSIQGT